uniref:Tight junction protein ZO-3 n=1 Tax=Mesocestoides corti TaxID=53468 RepID=A0A5K3EMT9_MESCO
MIFDVVLERQSQQGLGLAIKRGSPGEWVSYGALIVEILPTSPAYGKLQPGDVIMAVNGISLEHKSYPEMLDILRRTEGLVTLLVYRREDEGGAPKGVTSASCQSLFLPDGPSTHSPQSTPRRTFSMTGIGSPQVTPAHAASLPQLSARSEHEASGLTRDQRYASLLKVNFVKKHPNDGLGVELSGQLVVTSVTPGGKADHAGIRAGDRVITLNGIDAAHLSLIDAAYLMRREQSDVTLMRVEHEEEDDQACLPSEVGEPPDYENLHRCGHPCCAPQEISRPQEPLHVITSPMGYSPVLYRPIFSVSNMDNPAVVPGRQPCCRCHTTCPYCPGLPEAVATAVERISPPLLNIDHVDAEGDRPRVVTIQRHPVIGTGIRIIGGNAVGIFVSEVNAHSPASETGLRPGDEILSISGEPVQLMTKAEAALRILRSHNLLQMQVKHAPDKYEAFMSDKLGPGDDFHVRAAFNYIPNIVNESSMQTIDPAVSIPALKISHGDIFHVTDSLLAGSFTSWLARKVAPVASPFGSIPSSEKAIQLLKTQIPTLHSAEVASPYLRVGRLDRYPYPRPVIIYGPLADKAMRLLVEEVSTIEGGDEEARFEVPPISGTQPQPDEAWSAHLYPQCPGVIRLSAIQMVMEKGKHPVLNLRPSAIEGLIQNGIAPIVLLSTTNNAQQIRAALELYKPRCHGGTKELSRRLWTELTDLRQNIPHLLTDTVPLLNSPLQMRFDEVEWMHNLISVIRYHQSQPVWVAEDSVAFSKANEGTLTPMASPKENSKLTVEVASSDKSEHDATDDARLALNTLCREVNSSLGRAMDEWNMLDRLELVTDKLDARSSYSHDRVTVRNQNMRRVRIQSPRSETRSAQTNSPRMIETCIDAELLGGRESGAKANEVTPTSARRHRALSGRNAPCGLISEPQEVVAEVSGEFTAAEGGKLELPQHGVTLFIPPGALPDEEKDQKQEIYLRVYEGDNRGNAVSSGSTNESSKKSHLVSPLVMCGPRGMRFQKPATLTMPRFHKHCGNAENGGAWNLSVMHASTQSDGSTSASDAEAEQHLLRQWRKATADSDLEQKAAPAPHNGTESDSSGAGVKCQIADSLISILIDRF